ncbi:hypothetical protein TP70_09880 [Staphylococcus microti]|uniref:Uncharacterized protein n=1 Tax=Staphylococcus microti TaxID=569857 RepID=A0A0D6XMJ2_9STAP|nr:hypothetical protein TP70_09880 [Staphylococcus microti]PNZ79951.1 hypothetical protein CD132_08910 [Staphylococcus microti]SUM57096.1 Uncharacterised protein [Staphylococcus microti]
MKMRRISFFGVLIFLIVMLFNYMYQSVWLYHIGLSIFLIFAIYDVIKYGSYNEKVWLGVCIPVLILIEFFIYL